MPIGLEYHILTKQLKLGKEKAVTQKMNNQFMFWLQMFATFIFVLQFQATIALIGYDCGSRSLNIATISLLDVGQYEVPSK